MAEEKEADRRHGKEASPSGNMTPKRRTQAFWAAVLWPIPANLLVMYITLSMTRSYDSEWILYIAENQDTITQTMMVSTLLTTVIVAALGNKVQTLVAAVQPIIVQTARQRNEQRNRARDDHTGSGDDSNPSPSNSRSQKGRVGQRKRSTRLTADAVGVCGPHREAGLQDIVLREAQT